MALHEAAMKDEYFTSRRLAPNVDFWWVPLSIQMNSANVGFTSIGTGGNVPS
jgi:citrate synthase